CAVSSRPSAGYLPSGASPGSTRYGPGQPPAQTLAPSPPVRQARARPAAAGGRGPCGAVGAMRPRPPGRGRRMPSPRRRNWVGPAMAWLRPALAVAGAVVLVVAGVFAIGGLRGPLVSLANGDSSGSSASSNSGGGPNTNGSGSHEGSSTPTTAQASATPTQ